jgi:MarC family membrane protein
MDILSAVITLWLIMDPLGNVPVFLAVLKRVPPERRRKVLVREVLIAYVVLILFMLVGDRALALLQIKQETISIAGGIVLFLIALRMIFPSPEGIFGALPDREPMIFPLAVPMLAGPSALATVLLLGAQFPTRMFEWTAALAVATAVTALVLGLADRLQRTLGEPVVAAFERLMGLILAALAVEMLLSGLRTLKVIA